MDEMSRALMFQGTGSDVGKTVLVAGLCRLARNRGIKVQPFKPQNMSNNAAVAVDGGEIGRGQWLQALACGVDSSVHMNPVLLKPQSETGSQIIVQGKVFGKAKGADYQKLKATLLDAVMQSYRKIESHCDLILVEGAGSPAEINLRNGDIANMGFAREANIPVILIGDIDRGGVIASLVGTNQILDPDDRALVAGYLINKFRGDISLFETGIDSIGSFTGWPCFGVIPWLDDMRVLPAEDSMWLERGQNKQSGRIKIAVPVLQHIANFDDLDPLLHEDDVEVIFVKRGDTFPAICDLVILPGSKSTIADMLELRNRGWADVIVQHAHKGGRIIGICGGFQMLGKTIADPMGIEGQIAEIAGLGLLDITTTIKDSKVTRNVMATYLPRLQQIEGYEIHMGESQGLDCAHAVMCLDGEKEGAATSDGAIWGSYIHGLFQSDAFRKELIHSLGGVTDIKGHKNKIDQALNRIAEKLDKVVDVETLFALAR